MQREIAYIVRISSAIIDSRCIKLRALASTSGRLDVGCRCIIAALRLPNGSLRPNIRVFLVVKDGLILKLDSETELKHLSDSEVKVAYWILNSREKLIYSNIRGLKELVIKLIKDGYVIYLLEEKGTLITTSLRSLTSHGKLGFILGGPYGIPQNELKELKRLNIKSISIGSKAYLASFCIIILNYLLLGGVDVRSS